MAAGHECFVLGEEQKSTLKRSILTPMSLKSTWIGPVMLVRDLEIYSIWGFKFNYPKYQF